MALTGACDKIAISIWTRVTHSTNNICLYCFENNEAATVRLPGARWQGESGGRGIGCESSWKGRWKGPLQDRQFNLVAFLLVSFGYRYTLHASSKCCMGYNSPERKSKPAYVGTGSGCVWVLLKFLMHTNMCGESPYCILCSQKSLYLGIAEGLCFGRQNAGSTCLQFKDASFTRKKSFPIHKFSSIPDFLYFQITWHVVLTVTTGLSVACFELKILLLTQGTIQLHGCWEQVISAYACAEQGWNARAGLHGLSWSSICLYWFWLYPLLLFMSTKCKYRRRDQISEACVPALTAKGCLRTSSFELCRYN